MIKKTKKLKVSLKHDLTFKNFFKNNKKALKSLLENFLPLPPGKSIQNVEVLDSAMPILEPLESKAKNPIMDLRLKLDTGELVNVEMQMCPHAKFKERILYYWAKNYISQLKEGSEYDKLCPVYSLVFCDFGLFSKAKGFYSSFSLRADQEPYFSFTQDLRMVTVELRKFNKGKGDILELLDMREAWCYVLKWFEEMGAEDRELFARKNHKMEELMDWTRPLSLKEQEHILAEAREKNRRDRVARDRYVFQEGRAEGMEKGRAERDKEVILNMLKKQADIAFISEVTGLTVDEIKTLKNSS